MNIYNSSKKNEIAHKGKVAQNFITRTLGLLLRKDFNEDEFLIIRPCFSVHTFFMKFPIDILFVDRKGKIVGLHENVAPFKILPAYWSSSYVVELAAGQITRKNIQKGDIIQINE